MVCGQSWSSRAASPLLTLVEGRPTPWRRTLRALSSDTQKPQNDKSQTEDGESTKDIVLTPGEKVVVAGRLSLWLGVGAFAAVCAYYIGKELIPT